MQDTKTIKDQNDFTKEYSELVKSNKTESTWRPEVVKPNDMFVKFSLYVQGQMSTTSTNTHIVK